MKLIYIVLAIYFAVALWQAVYDGKGTAWQKVVRYLRALVPPATWIYEGIKKLVKLIKSK